MAALWSVSAAAEDDVPCHVDGRDARLMFPATLLTRGEVAWAGSPCVVVDSSDVMTVARWVPGSASGSSMAFID